MTRDLLDRRRADRESLRLPRHTTQTVTVDFDNPAPPGRRFRFSPAYSAASTGAPISGAGKTRGASIHSPRLLRDTNRQQRDLQVLAGIAPAGLASGLLPCGRNAHLDRRRRPVQDPGDSGRAARDRDHGLDPAVDDGEGCVHGRMGPLRNERDSCCVAIAGDRPPPSSRSRIRATISRASFRRFAKLRRSRVSRSERSSVRCGSSWH